MKKTPRTSKDNANVPLTKQTAGAVTGAVVGSMVAGPAGAIVGGVAGAMMGNRVEEGKTAVPRRAVAAAKSTMKSIRKAAGNTSVKSLTGKIFSLKAAAKSAKPTPKKASSKKSPAKKSEKKKPAKPASKVAAKRKK